jgi:hypothetical protein
LTWVSGKKLQVSTALEQSEEEVMIREFSVELNDSDREIIAEAAAGRPVFPEPKPGRKTFAFDDNALTAIAGDSFERFLWTAFDRVEEKSGAIILANDNGVSFYLPIDKLQDPAIRRAIYDFVSGRVGLNG